MPLTCHAFVAASLDGYIAREDGSIDWLEPYNAPGEDHGYDAFMADKNGIIIGRGTYETVLKFDAWPYKRPVIVLSQSLKPEDVPEDLAKVVAITDLEPIELLIGLAEEGWKKVYVDGGQVVQSFLNGGLLAEITLTRVPLLLGKGRPLFGETAVEMPLTLVESRSFPSGLVSSRYAVKPL